MRKGPGSVYYKRNIEKYHPRRRKRKLTEAPKLSHGDEFFMSLPLQVSMLFQWQSSFVITVVPFLHHFCIAFASLWSFQDGGLYITKKVGVKILTIIVLYRLS
jgi:hypothetical protein